MVKLRMYQVDAFADRVFRGNPAAVVPLNQWLDDSQLQGIATENNLSETAFFVPKNDKYHLRWFTPTEEVPLCGHATLAAAFIIFTVLKPSKNSVRFDTLSGELGVDRDGELLILDFPSRPPQSCKAPTVLIEGLGQKPEEVLKTSMDRNYYAVFNTEEQILALQPNLMQLEQLHPYGVVVTAIGNTSDFVSRYFVPSYGIPEDPVTGSTHCALVPYWSNRLGKTKLFARQVSKRGGELNCELLDNRVAIGGKAVQYLEGDIYIGSNF
jgi:PhzF family phenazine biosynthesis protein